MLQMFCVTRSHKAINKASQSIYIAMPEFTMTQLLECILCANSRGVQIHVILNNADGLENLPDVKKLLAEGKIANISLGTRIHFIICEFHFHRH